MAGCTLPDSMWPDVLGMGCSSSEEKGPSETKVLLILGEWILIIFIQHVHSLLFIHSRVIHSRSACAERGTVPSSRNELSEQNEEDSPPSGDHGGVGERAVNKRPDQWQEM